MQFREQTPRLDVMPLRFLVTAVGQRHIAQPRQRKSRAASCAHLLVQFQCMLIMDGGDGRFPLKPGDQPQRQIFLSYRVQVIQFLAPFQIGLGEGLGGGVVPAEGQNLGQIAAGAQTG